MKLGRQRFRVGTIADDDEDMMARDESEVNLKSDRKEEEGV
jgi:hypothetical protein